MILKTKSSLHDHKIELKTLFFAPMSQQLIYEIAHHRIHIDTPNAEVTEKLIPSFGPFRVDIIENSEPLIHFVGNQESQLSPITPH